MIKRLPGLTSVLVLAAALFAMAPVAKGQVTLPPTWKVDVTADAAAKAQGRNDFVEYIYIESTSFSGDQICKLGMVQTALGVTGSGMAGTYNVTCTMTSNTQGTISFTGTVSNTLMQGTLTWTTGGKVYNYTYRGLPFTPDPNAES
jgi:hypothetical protein